MTTDWPEAVREYEEHTTWRGGMAPGDLDKWWKEQREAIVKYGPPAIAALEKMVENARWAGKTWREQAEQAEAEVERLNQMLDLAWTERRKIRAERKYGISLRTKKMWLADLAARYEKEHKS